MTPTGNDKQSGSATAPWASVSRVNQMCFAAGDRIFFQASQVFRGRIYLNSSCQFEGTGAAPITVSSYGTGRATIDGGLEASDKGGLVVQDINFQTSTEGDTNDGVALYNTRRDHTMRAFIRIQNVDVSRFGGFGVVLGSWYPESGGFVDVRITRVNSFLNRKGGIVSYGAAESGLYVHKDIYVGYCGAYNNSGYRLAQFPSGWRPQGTGNGILLGNVDGGTIEYSTAFNNGSENDYIDGPVGIMVFDSRNMLIQQNTSYSNRSSQHDGNGFSLDRNTSNSILQNNWSWDNDGVGLYICQNNAVSNNYGNIVRYNSSWDDGRRRSYGGLSIWGPVRDIQIYGNTIVMSASTTGSPKAVSFSNYGLPGSYMSNITFYGNAVETHGNVPLVNVEASLLEQSTGISFKSNAYTAEYFNIIWGSYSYASLAAWTAATGQW